MSAQPSHRDKEISSRRKRRAATWRILWLVLVIAGVALVYPWRAVENTEEIEKAQELVGSMSEAHRSIAVTGDLEIDEVANAAYGFEGMETQTPGGVPALGLVGASDENCLVMHWTAPEEAQVGRLPPEWPCSPSSIAVVPLTAHDGYVPGTGPPFDVTTLIREAHTPIWFIAALVILIAIALKAAVDLFLILMRPDDFFSGPD